MARPCVWMAPRAPGLPACRHRAEVSPCLSSAPAPLRASLAGAASHPLPGQHGCCAAQSWRSRARGHSSRRIVRATAAFVVSASAEAPANALSGKAPRDVSVLVVGSTGYIGSAVTKELVSRGYNVIAVTRQKSGKGGIKGVDDVKAELAGADTLVADVTDISSLNTALEGQKVDAVVSCLGSRTGAVKDSWLIDYTATKNAMEAAQAAGAKHFVLLSAICVQKPLLEFQRAKRKVEEELQAQTDMTYSIVRPTALLKSFGIQVENVMLGAPFLVYGDGTQCACKPISEADLASYITDAVQDPSLANKVLPIGGPGAALTPLQQGEMLFDVLDMKPSFVKVPTLVLDLIAGVLDVLSKVFKNLEDAAESAKIGRYYATESLLVYDPRTGKYDAEATPEYGKDTLREFFEKVAKEGMASQRLGDQAVLK